MKILHTSDWHLGKYLEAYSRLDEQKEVLEEICNIADENNVNAILIAGDLFDNYNPSIEAIDLFYKTLKKLSNNGKRAVIAIAGNHDSPFRVEAPDPLARECGIIFNGFYDSLIPKFSIDSGLSILKSEPGFIEIKVPDIDFPLRVILAPYANEIRMKTCFDIKESERSLRELVETKWKKLSEKYCNEKGANIMISHLLFMNKDGKIPEESDDERSIIIGGASALYTENIPKNIQYVALGHLHKFQEITKPVIYSGSPISYSLSESEQKKYVILIDIEPAKTVNYNKIVLKKGKKLLRREFKSITESCEWLKNNQDSLVELTIRTKNYIKAEDRKLLNETHSGIISIIPKLLDDNIIENNNSLVDINKNIEELFCDYFKSENNNIPPNKELLELFKEVISIGDEK